MSYNDETVNSDSNKKGSLMIGLLVGIGITIVFELLIGLLLDVQENLVHRYLAYMLGIAVLFVSALITKSVLKMFFIGTPIIVITSFILPYFVPQYFSPLMAPFLTLMPIIERIYSSASTFGLDTASIESYMVLVRTYGILLDLLLAIIVGTLAGLGISFIIKLFTGKPNVLTIFTFAFGILFFLIGVIILPYVLVITTGVIQFGASFGIGGLAMSEGMNAATNGSLSVANDLFAEAGHWFNESESMLNGLKSMQLFLLLGMSTPQYKVIIDNGLLLISASINLAQGIAPSMTGIAKIQDGIKLAMSVLNMSSALALSTLTDDDLTTFNSGIAEMEEGFANLTKAIPNIKDALSDISEVDVDALNQALLDATGTDYSDNLSMVDGGTALLDATLNTLKVLITDPEGPNRAPFIHLLYGALALFEIQGEIGDSTAFEGTGSLFQQVVGNLSIVVDSFDDPAFTAFNDLDVSSSTQINDFKNEINGVFQFVKDAGHIAISIGEFGIIATPSLEAMNDSVSIFSESTNFSVIDDTVYDAKISLLDDVITNGSLMMAKGQEIDSRIRNMNIKSQNNTYGMMSDAATDFTDLFTDFNLTENGMNFYYLAGGFQSILKTIKILKHAQNSFGNLETSINKIQGSSDNATIINELNNINANLTISEGLLNDSLVQVDDAIGNFTNLIPTMPQMNTTATALINIRGDIVDILGYNDNRGITKIKSIASDQAAFLSDPVNKLNEIQVELDYINTKFADINNQILNISISK